MYKDEKAMLAQVYKEQDEKLNQVKKYVYPFWTIVFVLNSVLAIGWYYQQKTIMKGQQRIDKMEKFESYLPNKF
jgi:hypothetical protein